FWRESDNKITLFTQGFGLVGFVRPGQDQQNRWLIDGQNEKSVLEGSVQPGDVLLLSTARGRDLQISLDEIGQQNPDDMASALFAPVQKHQQSGEIAVQFAQVISDEESENASMDDEDYSPIASPTLSEAKP